MKLKKNLVNILDKIYPNSYFSFNKKNQKLIIRMKENYPKMLTYLKYASYLVLDNRCCVSGSLQNSDLFCSTNVAFSFFVWRTLMITAQSQATDSVLSLRCNISEQKDNHTLVLLRANDHLSPQPTKIYSETAIDHSTLIACQQFNRKLALDCPK